MQADIWGLTGRLGGRIRRCEDHSHLFLGMEEGARGAAERGAEEEKGEREAEGWSRSPSPQFLDRCTRTLCGR